MSKPPSSEGAIEKEFSMVRVQGSRVLVRSGMYPWDNEEFLLEDLFTFANEKLSSFSVAGVEFQGTKAGLFVDFGEHTLTINRLTFEPSRRTMLLTRQGDKYEWTLLLDSRVANSAAA